ncbi:MAG: DUF4038 domain-containing protein [Chloroflexi bacterium]|nr:DUF4038 domain-containing protein [Chloroflexota bacterium]
MFRIIANTTHSSGLQYRPVELILRAADAAYALDPDAALRVWFRHESGNVCSGLGFADGGVIWRIRFTPLWPGRWEWHAAAGDPGLDGASGEVRVAPAAGTTLFERHGPLASPAPGARVLSLADGTPFFWLGDTAWEAPASALPAEWEVYLARRAAQGFSVVQMNLLPQWDAALPHRRLPFLPGAGGAPDPDRLDPAYFQELDQIIDRNAEMGLLSALVVLWFNYAPGANPPFYNPPPEGLQLELTTVQARRLAAYAGARYGAYPVAWLLTGDIAFTNPEDEETYGAIAEGLHEASFVRAPMTAHINGDMPVRQRVARQPWLDVHMFQSCHFAHGGGFPAAYTRAARALHPSRPVVNGEQCYEQLGRIHGAGRFDRDDVRRAAWEAALAGACGITYGAHGIWPWYREGTTFHGAAAWQAPPRWDEALAFPGSDDVARMKRLLESLPWWTLNEAPDLPIAEDPAGDAIVARLGATHVVAYLRAARPLRLTDSRLAGSPARWVDPASGAEEPAVSEPFYGGMRVQPPSWAHDAVLVIVCSG